MKLEQKFGKDGQQLSEGFGTLKQEVMSDFQEACQIQEANAEWIQDKYVNETVHLLKTWGCNSTCVNNMQEGDEWNLGGVI